MKSLLISVFLLLITSLASATDVTVTGQGTTSDEAVLAALRAAIEKASGAYIYSETTVKDSSLVSDQIVSVSRSLVKDHTVLSKGIADGIHWTTVRVSVDPITVKAAIRQRNLPTTEDALKDYRQVTNQIEQLQRAAHILDSMRNQNVRQMYSAQYLGYDIVKAGLSKVTVRIRYSISMNPFFWAEYTQILDHIKIGKPGLFSSASKDVGLACLGYKCEESVFLHKELIPHAVGSRSAKVLLETDDFKHLSKPFVLIGSNMIHASVHDAKNAMLCYENRWSICSGVFIGGLPRNVAFDEITSDGLERSVTLQIDPEMIKRLPLLRAWVVSHRYDD